MRAFDWSATPLGEVATWPQSLRSTLGICLVTRFPIAIYWGPELALLYNDAWSPILGLKHPWGLGRPAAEVWPEIWNEVGPLFARALQGDATYSEDALLPMHRHGYTEECYFNFTFSPVRDESGKVGGIFNAVIETTERVVSERRLRTLRALGENVASRVSAAEVCRGAAEVLGNNAVDVPFALVFTTDADGALTLAASVGIDGDRRAIVARHACSALSGAGAELQIFDASAHGLALDGLGTWPEPPRMIGMLPLASAADGARMGALVVGISPRRPVDASYEDFLRLAGRQIATSIANARAYEAEKQRAEALAEIDRAKTVFFSNVSHEFRTPLTLMLGPTEDALASGEGALKGADLEVVYRNELRLLKLVNTLLDFSRIEAGRMRASYEPTDLAALTTDLASAFRSAMDRAGLSFEVDIPPVSAPVYVDHGMWEKIVLNLLSNALKFTFEGSVRVALEEHERTIELRVSDTGVGVPEHELPRLFERFHRIEGSRARTHEGSGIGLALVRDLVRLHAGTIDVTSRVGHGTTFSVVLPRGSAHVPEAQLGAGKSGAAPVAAAAYVQEAMRWLPGAAGEPGAETDATKAAPGVDTSRHVLVADDNADMRDYVARLLGERWSVEVVADGVEALAAARRRRPDLVLTDVMMPNLDGFGLLRALRSDAKLKTTPIVLLSARAGEEARVEGVESGADDYLVKPFSARELLARVATQLELGALRRAAELERERLSAIFEQAPVAIALWHGAERRFIFANETYCEATARRDLPGKLFADVFPELDSSNETHRLYAQALAGATVQSRDRRVLLERHGQLVETYWSTTFQPIREQGRITAVMAIAAEVTEEVNARREATTLATVVAHASDLVAIATLDAAVTFVNDAGKRLLATETCLPLVEYFPLEDRACAAALVTEARDHGHVAREARLQNAQTKEIVPVWFDLFTLADPKTGAPYALAAVAHDLRRMKRDAAERERLLLAEQAARTEAERANRMKDEFLATISHELRTPLNAILGWATLLRGGAQDAAVRDRALATIERNAKSQARLIEDILDVSRIISGKLRLDVKRFDVATIVNAAVEVVRPAASARTITLDVRVADGVGSVEGDPDRVQQVVWNLLINAVRFTSVGGTIAVLATRDDEEVELRVRDSGVGIAAADLPHIFERFRQVDSSTTRQHGGLGLGLAIVRHLVELHGGVVTAESEGLGKGATFIVRLPARATPMSAAKPRTSKDDSMEAPVDASAAKPLAGVRIVVADDDVDSRDVIATTLERAGAQVALAASAREALELVLRTRPDVLVSDIGMPGEDGYALIRQVRSLPASSGGAVPAVALTAYARTDDEQRALTAGFHEHVAKPADPGTLTAVVARLATRRA